MLKEKWESIKSLVIKKKEDGSKQNIQNLIVFLVILIITIIAINVIWNEEEPPSNTQAKLANIEQNNQEEQIASGNDNLEQRLENILQNIEGVGKVQVLITYSESSQVVTVFNENTSESSTEEADSSGGTRKITQVDTSKEMAYTEENGEKVPITEKVIMPKIEGAIITAQGATNAEVKTNIIQAVEAATGLATHKIQVFPMQT